MSDFNWPAEVFLSAGFFFPLWKGNVAGGDRWDGRLLPEGPGPSAALPGAVRYVLVVWAECEVADIVEEVTIDGLYFSFRHVSSVWTPTEQAAADEEPLLNTAAATAAMQGEDGIGVDLPYGWSGLISWGAIQARGLHSLIPPASAPVYLVQRALITQDWCASTQH